MLYIKLFQKEVHPKRQSGGSGSKRIVPYGGHCLPSAVADTPWLLIQTLQKVKAGGQPSLQNSRETPWSSDPQPL